MTHYLPLDASLRPSPPPPPPGAGTPHLFAYPAQSNFSGARHPLAWCAHAQALGYRVLLDAAAFLPGARLSLRTVRPDFLCLSFYKLCGFPTGIGALVARRDALVILRRPWFAGGTVDWVSTQYTAHALRPTADAFEDGTPDFLAGDAVHDGLDLLERIGMEHVEQRLAQLTAYLIAGLTRLRHDDGSPVVHIYGPLAGARGGTVAFNVRSSAGDVIPFDRVVHAAAERGVSVRGGCFCNPGCAERAFGIDAERARACRSRQPYAHERFAQCMAGPIGAVRASVGIPTVYADIDRLLEVIESFAVERTVVVA